MILGVDTGERGERGLGLYTAGSAPRLMVSEDHGETMEYLEGAGLERGVIVHEDASKLTWGKCINVKPLLQELGSIHVIFVTSWCRARRARAVFEHLMLGIRFQLGCGEQTQSPGYEDRRSLSPEELALFFY